MLLRKSANRNVHPGVAAVAIVFVLAAVQYVWWMKLVHRPRVPSGGGPSPRGPQPPAPPTATGLVEVQVDTIAGAPDPGDADGPGRDARFDGPSSIALTSSGSIYVADTRNNRIRLVDINGKTRTVTGSVAGYRDGTLAEAQFNSPSGICVGAGDAVYVADTANHRIRMIKKGRVTTIAGGDRGFADGDGANAKFDLPAGLCRLTMLDGSQNLLVADSANRKIRKVAISGGAKTVSTLSSLDKPPISISANGDRAVVAVHGLGLTDLAGHPIPPISVKLDALFASSSPKNAITLNRPLAPRVSTDGWFMVDETQGSVFLVNAGSATVLAGRSQVGTIIRGFRDGTGMRAAFGLLADIAVDSAGRIYVADCGNNCIRRLTIPTKLLPWKKLAEGTGGQVLEESGERRD